MNVMLNIKLYNINSQLNKLSIKQSNILPYISSTFLPDFMFSDITMEAQTSTIMGIFAPWKSTNVANQLFPREPVVNHLPAHQWML